MNPRLETLKSLEEHNAHLSSELSGAAKHIILLQAQYNILFQEHQALLEEFHLDKNGNPLPKPVLTKEKVAEIKVKYAKLSEQQPKIIKLEQELAAANEELRVLKLKNNDAKVFNTTPRTPRTTELESALAAANKELRELKQKYQAELSSKPAAPTIAALTSEASKAKKDYAQQERVNKDLSKQLKDMTNDMLRYKDASERLAKTVESSSFDLRTSRSNIEKHENKIQELTNQLEAATADSNKYKGESERLAGVVDSLKLELRGEKVISHAHAKRVAELDILVRTVTDMYMNVKDTPTQVDELTAEVAALNHALDVANAQIEELKQAPVKRKNEKVPAEVARLNQIIQTESAEALRQKEKGKARIVDPVEVVVKPKKPKKSVRFFRPQMESLSKTSSADGLGIDTSATLERKHRFHNITEPCDVFRSSDSTGAGSDPHKMDDYVYPETVYPETENVVPAEPGVRR